MPYACLLSQREAGISVLGLAKGNAEGLVTLDSEEDVPWGQADQRGFLLVVVNRQCEHLGLIDEQGAIFLPDVMAFDGAESDAVDIEPCEMCPMLSW